jgi:Flp pilus assembly protein TadG
MNMARFSKFLTDKHGTTAVEFSLVAMLFLTLVFGLFETARLFLAQSAIQYAVEEATATT